MIFIGFILISSLFFLYAFFAGNVMHFFNLDSILIIPVALFIFSAFSFKWKSFINGIKSMFVFNITSHMKSKEVSDHYKSLMIISLTVGVVSTIQGLISYALLIRDLSAIATNMPFPEALSYAIFSTVYAIMISMFLLYPVHILNRDIN